MAYFPHAYQKALVATSLVTAAGTASSALTAGQLALINAQTNLSCDLSGATTLNYNNASTGVPLAYLAQGSFHTVDKLGPFHGGYKESVKSKGINPKYISAFTLSEPLAPVQDIKQVGIVNTTTGAAFNAVITGSDIACNSTYRLRLDIKGSPTLRFLTHNAYFTLDAYSGCCSATNALIDPNVVLLGWLDQIAYHPWLSNFVSAKVWNRNDATVATTGVAATATSLTSANVATAPAAGSRILIKPTLATASTATFVGNLMTVVSTPASGMFTVGQLITITGYGTASIIGLGTGVGGAGTYLVNKSVGTVGTAVAITTSDPLLAYVGAGATTTSIPLVAASAIGTPSASTVVAFVVAAATPIKIYSSITTAAYTPLTVAASVDAVDSFVELTGAYVDTTFGDCSFAPRDHVEYQPVEIYSSIVDNAGLPCVSAPFVETEPQQSIQGRGFGETLIRELILAKRYQQEPWIQDPRMREILDYNPFGEITRANRYFIYNILHSVPRKSNPSGTMDNDQYLIRIFTASRLSALETNLDNWMTTAGNYDNRFKLLA
jgi:hypothetical protein